MMEHGDTPRRSPQKTIDEWGPDQSRRTDRPLFTNERQEVAPESTYPEPARVLIAEDDPDMREMLLEELQGAGFNVSVANDGRELMDFLSAQAPRFDRPDLVISDVRMPGYSGLEVLTALRESDWSMPFVVITAFGDNQLHEEAARLGAARVFDKPFDLDVLMEAARELTPPPI